MSITLLPHATAILDRLETWPGLATVKIGDHVAPKSSTGKIVAPSAVLYLRPGGEITGSLGCLDTDGWLPFQITCVGQVAQQAMWVADRVHEALTSSPLLVTDRFVGRLRRTYLGPHAERDEDVSPPLFYVAPEYRLWTIEA